ADPDFSGIGLAQKFDIAYALPQLIEGGATPRQQSVSDSRQFDTSRAALEQPCAQRGFQARNHGRDRWLGHAKFGRRLGHAAAVCNGEEYLQIAQLETPPDILLPVNVAGHRRSSIGIVLNSAFCLLPGRAILAIPSRLACRDSCEDSVR